MYAPTQFWPKALLNACYFLNRLPTSALQNQIQFSVLFPNKPLSHVNPKVFGCTCFTHVLEPRKDKLSPKSIRCIFLGYSRLKVPKV